MSDLAKKSCVSCRGGVPLKGEGLAKLQAELGGDWQVVDEQRLTKTYRFADFAKALAYVNKVGVMADEQDHHPDIHLAWGKVGIEIWSHDAGGLTENDFIFAAKADALL